MRILIIRPRDRVRYPRFFAKIFRIHEIGLLQIAGAIKDFADIVYVDENHKKLPTNLPADLVLINVQTHSSLRAFQLAKHYSNLGIRVVLGGPHITLCPQESLQHADSIVIGPGDVVIKNLISDFQNGNLQRIYKGHEWHSHFSSPHYKLIQRGAIFNLMPVVISRGCQHSCSHCVIANINHGRVSVRDAEEIIADINRIKSRRFYFIDDNLLANRDTLLKVLRYLACSSKPRKWIAQITSKVIYDREIMQLLEPSGCKLLFIGFDSMQKHSLRYINSFKTGEALAQTVEELHNLNISVIGSFMFGMDGDRLGDIIKTTEIAIKAGLDAMALNIFTPIPGTAIFDNYLSEGRIFENDLSRYDFKNIVFHPKHFSAAELWSEFTTATQMFYSMKGFLKRIPKIKNRSFTIPLNILYNPTLSKSLRLNWRNRKPQNFDQIVLPDYSQQINLAN